jgi:uncharacterized alpha-E superfamily protein
MLSRVADAIYWASRYVERAENVARFVNVNLDLMLDSPAASRPSWQPLVQTTGDQTWFEKHYSNFSPENVTRFLTFDRSYPNSISSSVASARENARTVREVISREMWEELNALFLMVRDASKQERSPEAMADFYDRVRSAGIHYAGATDATLSHGEAWHFSRLGRMLERADKTSRILDVKYFVLLPELRDIGSTVDQVGWTALLNSASALQMYRQQHQVIAPTSVAKFLLLDAHFPRSIRHCVHRMQESLHDITGTPIGSYTTEAERLMGTLRSDLDYAEIDRIMEIGLHEYLDKLQHTMNRIGAAITEHFVKLDS